MSTPAKSEKNYNSSGKILNNGSSAYGPNGMQTTTKDDNSRSVRILAVKWNEIVIGYLMQEVDVGYLFKYDANGMKMAKEQGYSGLMGFPNLRKVYISDQMPQAFSSRLPSKQRRDLTEKLKENGMEDYDQMEYLSRTGGKLHTDSISFEEFVPKIKSRMRRTTTVTKNIRKVPIRSGNNRGNSGREFE